MKIISFLFIPALLSACEESLPPDRVALPPSEPGETTIGIIPDTEPGLDTEIVPEPTYDEQEEEEEESIFEGKEDPECLFYRNVRSNLEAAFCAWEEEWLVRNTKTKTEYRVTAADLELILKLAK